MIRFTRLVLFTLLVQLLVKRDKKTLLENKMPWNFCLLHHLRATDGVYLEYSYLRY